MTTILIDTHVAHWLAADPARLTETAVAAVGAASELAVAGPTWYELAWLHQSGRLRSTLPLRHWLDRLAEGLRTLPLTPAVAARAVALPADFPRDPFDRIIFATAVEHGLRLVTRDEAIRRYDAEGRVVVW